MKSITIKDEFGTTHEVTDPKMIAEIMEILLGEDATVTRMGDDHYSVK